MIDNMQANAMASYGDWGGVGIAVKPHLPPINPKYDKSMGGDNDNDNDNDNDVNMNEQKDNDGIGVGGDDKKANNSLSVLLDKYYEKHKHRELELKVLKNELEPKITNDDKNAQLYVSMICRDNEMNARQQEGLNEFVKFLNNKRMFSMCCGNLKNIYKNKMK